MMEAAEEMENPPPAHMQEFVQSRTASENRPSQTLHRVDGLCRGVDRFLHSPSHLSVFNSVVTFLEHKD